MIPRCFDIFPVAFNSPRKKKTVPASRHRYCYPFDDTVAIKSEKAEGLDGFPFLLRRCRLPKGTTSVPGNDFFVGALAQAPLATPEPRKQGHSQRQPSALSSTLHGYGGGGGVGGYGGGGGDDDECDDCDQGEATSGGIGGTMVTWRDLR